MYVQALADICILFDTLDVIPRYAIKIIVPCCVNGKEKQFLALVQQHTYQEKDYLSIIASAYQYLDSCWQVTTYSSWRGKDVKEKRYQCVRCFIFQKYLAFKSMKYWKDKLDNLFYPQLKERIQNNNVEHRDSKLGYDSLIVERPTKTTIVNYQDE